jgi:hypothetical protein
MKRIALMFALFFVVALIFPADAPAPLRYCGDGNVDIDLGEECDPPDVASDDCGGEVCLADCTCPDIPDPYCGDGIVNQDWEICDGDDDEACPGECKDDCTCPECGDGILDPDEECDPNADPTGCEKNEVCTDDCICEPMGGGEGCTPGFWKGPAFRWGYWPAPYTPDTMFCDVFECAFPGKTLLMVLGQDGGGLNALGRHTVAALLNAASADVSYDLTVDEVIDMFNEVYPESNTEDYNYLKDTVFEYYNEQGCPIGREDVCKGDFDTDNDVDGNDAFTFKGDFGRNALKNPCNNDDNLCKGNFDSDADVDGSDANVFKSNFGRNPMNNPCPPLP